MEGYMTFDWNFLKSDLRVKITMETAASRSKTDSSKSHPRCAFCTNARAADIRQSTIEEWQESRPGTSLRIVARPWKLGSEAGTATEKAEITPSWVPGCVVTSFARKCYAELLES